MIVEGRYINSECKLIFGMSRNEEISQLDIELLNYLLSFFGPLHGFFVHGNVLVDLIVHEEFRCKSL